MKFLKNLFGKKKDITYEQLIFVSAFRLLEICGINQPTDIQVFKMFSYLCVVGRIYINLKIKDNENKKKEFTFACRDLASKIDVSIDELVEATFLWYSISDSIDSTDYREPSVEKKSRLEKFLSKWTDGKIPIFHAFQYIIESESSKYRRNASAILIDKMNGPFGFGAIAGIIIIDGVLGLNKSKELLPLVLTEIDVFLNVLIEI
jgi:hypothetical protein